MKRNKENKIIKIIREKNVKTQMELTKYLREVGEEMAQSTLSRDLREIGVIKIPSGEGFYKYELSDEVYSGSSSSLGLLNSTGKCNTPFFFQNF